MRGTAIGSYALLEQLGEGGTGTVWLAEHTLLGRRAAIKLLHPEVSANEIMVQRFFNEARAIAAIADPGIVQLFDFGVHTDGAPYIVMELLEGEPLDARLRRVGRLASQEAVRLARQVAMSLSVAHGKGVIHRDLKPENLFVVADPAVVGGERLKVLDFGIAKLIGGERKYRTRTGAVVGTPAYMSPEQCRAIGNIDHRADIYSLGAVLFCLVTGRPPFEGEGAGDAIISHVRDQPPVPSSLVPDLPGRLDSVILRCLEKEPARRYQAMDELARALEGLEASPGGRAGTAATPPGRAAAPAAPAATTADVSPSLITTMSDALGEVAPGRRSRRWRWVGLAVSGGLGLGIAGAIAVRGLEGPAEKAGPAAASPLPVPAPVAEPPVDPPDAAAASEPSAGSAAAAAAASEPSAGSAAAAAPDAWIEADVDRAAAGADAGPARPPPARPSPVQRPRDKRRDKEGTTRHGSETKASPGNVGRIDRGD